MILLTAEKISKNYGIRPLIDHLSLTVSEGDKIGIIGVNGTGKTTLLKMLAGIEPPGSGEISRSSALRVGYLPQNPVFEENAPVLRQAAKNAVPGQTFQEYEYKSLLTKLGITDFEQNISELSGGQRKRVALAAALASHADLLILDEPTNHIDGETVARLEAYLGRYTGALLMVTHDRYFLERVVNQIAELENGSLTCYPANYSRYLELKAERESMQSAARRKQQVLYRKELEWIRRGARARSTKAKFRVDRFAELDRETGPVQRQELDLSSLSARLGKKVMEIDGISKSYGGRVLFRDFSYNLLRRDRIGIIGPNGCGKTTLFKILRGLVPPDTGRVEVGETVKIGCFSQENEEMDLSLRVIDYIRSIAEQIRTPDGMLTASQMLERFLFPPEMQYTEISRLSGGERRRLFLLGVLAYAPNVLLLDEPTNDLDIETLTILEDYLLGFPGAVVAISHDRYFMDKIAEHVFAFENGVLNPYLGGYSDYLAKRPEPAEPERAEEKPEKQKARRGRSSGRLKFTYREQREFEQIDGVVSGLENSLKDLRRQIEDQSSNYAALEELLAEKSRLEAELAEKTDRWVYLNELAEKIENQKRDGSD